jgi:hypothetical protein
MAEWLRRQIRISIRYLFPSGSAGSNPAGVVFFHLFLIVRFPCLLYVLNLRYTTLMTKCHCSTVPSLLSTSGTDKLRILCFVFFGKKWFIHRKQLIK